MVDWQQDILFDILAAQPSNNFARLFVWFGVCGIMTVFKDNHITS